MLTTADYSFIIKYGDLTPDGVAVYDLNSRKFVYLNRFFQRMFCVEKDLLLDDPRLIIECVHPDDLAFLDDRYRELLSIGCIGPIEFRLLMKDGEIKYVSSEVLWVEESYSFAIFAKDISPQRLHEEYVLHFTAQKDALLDMLIHNLSSPLYISREVLKVLSAKNATHPEGKEVTRLIEMIRQGTEQCIDIVNDFLTEEHLASLKTSVKKSRFDMVEKTDLILELLRQMNPGKKFSLEPEERPMTLNSDAVKFCQVMHNLLSNAVKYTPDDGNISISLKNVDKACSVTIADNGTGISKDLKKQIFHDRVQGLPGLKGEKSNGVGLLTVKKLVDLLEGKVWLESEVDKGTSVHLEIPQD